MGNRYWTQGMEPSAEQKEIRKKKREPGGLGKILDNSAKKASLYLEEIKEVNPVSLRLNEFG